MILVACINISGLCICKAADILAEQGRICLLCDKTDCNLRRFKPYHALLCYPCSVSMSHLRLHNVPLDRIAGYLAS